MFLRTHFNQIKWTFFAVFLEEAEAEITVKWMALSDFSVNISCFPSTAQSAEFSWVAPGLKSSPLNARVTYDISEGGKN